MLFEYDCRKISEYAVYNPKRVLEVFLRDFNCLYVIIYSISWLFFFSKLFCDERGFLEITSNPSGFDSLILIFNVQDWLK